MFNGTENFDDEYFKPFEEVGATSQNGTTWFDRTNYFQNVPSTALDMALWMESDRMGHLLGAVTQEKLDNQRGVVQNEKRQGDNRPYGRAYYRILEGLFPEGHSYRWSTIGSLEDLDAASLDDVKAWFKEYYGAANTVLVLAGDINTDEALQKVNKYFGDIPSGPPLTKKKSYLPIKQSITKEVMYDKVPQKRIYRAWAVPGRTTVESEDLQLAARLIGSGKTSRLYQRLLIEESLATQVAAYVEEHELASIFHIRVTLKNDANEAKVEAIIDKELEKFFKEGPSTQELESAKTTIFADMIRGLEVVGGFNGKANTLAKAELYGGDSNFYMEQLRRFKDATQVSVRKTAQKWLVKPYHQVTVKPFPNYTTIETDVDRSKGVPKVDSMPELEFPEVIETKLNNGIPVYVVERPTIPAAQISFVFNAGYASDSAGHDLGTATFMMDMLKEGTKKLDATQLQTELDKLGAILSVWSNLDTSTLELDALSANLAESLTLATDILKAPALREKDIEKLMGLRLAGIEQEKASPVSQALRVLPPLIYGDNHPYSIPFTGSGHPETVTQITNEKLKSYHQKWIRPDNLSIVVVGDVRQDKIVSLLNKQLSDWKVSGSKGEIELTEVKPKTKPIFYLVDKPAAPQSLILAGKVTPSTKAEDHLIFDTSNLVIGGKFTARVNMNLREAKGWAYGAYTFYRDAKGQKPWMVYAPVQTDKTVDSVKELIKEITEYRTTKPATEEELTLTTQGELRSLPGRFETNGSLMGELISSITYDRPMNYPATLNSLYKNVSVAELKTIAEKQMNLDELVWVIVGDVSKIRAGVEELGEVELLEL